MWANIGRLFVKYIGLPLLIQGGQILISWITSYFKRKENAAEAQKKCEDYEASKDKTDSGNNFSNLP